MRWTQQALQFPNTWGGKRKGAGRKRTLARPNVPHRARPRHIVRHPVHVTLRSLIKPLRSQHVFPTLCLALARATRRDPASFRVVHFSVQWDHVHLVVEASDQRALSSGLRSIAIRIARYVNDLLGRSGRLWADRWHGHELASPREVRNAFAYVLTNFRKHTLGAAVTGIDPFSSAALFDGWRGHQRGAELPRAGPYSTLVQHVVVTPARTWLAQTGWRRAGLVRIDETPRQTSNELRG